MKNDTLNEAINILIEFKFYINITLKKMKNKENIQFQF